MRYPAGTVVIVAAEEYRNDAGALVNPVDVSLWYRRPDGTEETIAKADLDNPAVGTWQDEVTADQAGDWVYAFTATTPTITTEGTFTVTPLVMDGDPMQPGAGPCDDWCTIDDVLEGWTAPDLATDRLIGLVIGAVSDLLYQRSARQFPGICSDVVIPAPSAGCLVALPHDGEVSLWSRAGGTFLHSPKRVDLGSYPVRQVIEVLIDGVALAASAWRVADWRWLVRTDGGTWPANTAEDTDDPPRLEVSLTFGVVPPDSGNLAAVVLVRELVKGLVGGKCALDRRVETLNREGVTITIPGLVDSLKEGKTGVAEVDLFLWAHNPNGLSRRGRLLLMGGGRGTTRRTFG